MPSQPPMLTQAILLIRRGAYPQAIGLLQQAVIAQPQHFETRLQLAKAYLDWVNIQLPVPLTEIQPEALDEHIGHFLKLAESQLVLLAKTHSSSPHVQGLLAVVHLAYKRPAEALACLKKALIKDPLNPDLLFNMGVSLMELKCFDEAVKQFTRLTTLYPDHGMGWHMLGMGETSRQGGVPEVAFSAYHRAIELLPKLAKPYGALGTAYFQLGRYAEGLPYLDRAIELAPEDLLDNSNLLFKLHYHPGLTAAEMAARHRAFGERFEVPLKSSWRPHANLPDPERKLRVGFFSGDLGNHPVGYFMADLLAGLKSRGIELVAYSSALKHDAITARIKPQFTIWRECKGLSMDALATQVRADGIDILVDLSGHTTGNRLMVFAHKPAPVQVTYLGYFDTTGLTAMDYILGNRWLLPEAEAHLYTERPWWLPDAHLCLTPPDEPVEVGALPARHSGQVTFGCFNNAKKVNPRVIACWARILHDVPESRLYLKSGTFDRTVMTGHYQRQFSEHGIKPERLLLEGKSSFKEYLESYHRVDIALDPYPYNGGTTTVQALWMGVPVLALQGDRYVAHMGESILHAVNVPEWIAMDEDDYVAKAVAFASDLRALADMRAGLRQRLLDSPICDAPRFARNLEEAFRGMWRTWCEQQKPPKAAN